MRRFPLAVMRVIGVLAMSGVSMASGPEAHGQSLERSPDRVAAGQTDRGGLSPAWSADPGRTRAEGRDARPVPDSTHGQRPGVTRSVGQRWPTSELGTLGGRLGPFDVRPYLNVVESYNSNIHATEDDPEGDFITRLQPGFALTSNWARHAIGLRASGDFAFHADNGSENHQDVFVGGDGRLDILHGTSLSVNASFQRDHSARSSPDGSTASETPKVFHRSDGAVALTRDRGRINAMIDGTVSHTDFKDGETVAGATIDNDGEDNLVLAPGLRVGYAPTPSSEVYARARYVTVTYVNTPAGAASDDSWGLDAILGASRTFDAIWSVGGYIGHAPRFFEDGARENIGGMTGTVGGANVAWNPTADLSALFDVSHGASATKSGGASAIATTRVGLSVEKELGRRVLVDASFGFQHADYIGSSRLDRTYTAEASGAYLIGPWASVMLDYGYVNRDSNAPGSSYDQHRLGLGVALRY